MRVIHQGRYKRQTPLSLSVTVLNALLSSTINTNYFPLGPGTNMLFSGCGNDFHQAFFFKNMTFFYVCVRDKCNLCPYMQLQLYIGGNVNVYNSKSEKWGALCAGFDILHFNLNNLKGNCQRQVLTVLEAICLIENPAQPIDLLIKLLWLQSKLLNQL